MIVSFSQTFAFVKFKENYNVYLHYNISTNWHSELRSLAMSYQGLRMKRGYVHIIYMHIAPFHSQPSICMLALISPPNLALLFSKFKTEHAKFHFHKSRVLSPLCFICTLGRWPICKYKLLPVLFQWMQAISVAFNQIIH